MPCKLRALGQFNLFWYRQGSDNMVILLLHCYNNKINLEIWPSPRDSITISRTFQMVHVGFHFQPRVPSNLTIYNPGRTPLYIPIVTITIIISQQMFVCRQRPFLFVVIKYLHTPSGRTTTTVTWLDFRSSPFYIYFFCVTMFADVEVIFLGLSQQKQRMITGPGFWSPEANIGFGRVVVGIICSTQVAQVFMGFNFALVCFWLDWI